MWIGTSDGHALWCEQRGQGPDVVLVGGWTGMVEMWTPVVDILSASARCTSYDLRGNGRSDKPDGSYDLAQHTADLRALLEQLEVRSPLVIGHSLGAMIALSAVAAGVEVEGLVLTGAFPSGRLLEELATFDLRAAIKEAAPNGEARAKLFEDSGAPGSIGLETTKWPTASILRNADAFLDGDVSGLLSGIDVPTLVLHGDEDIVAPADPCANLLADGVPTADLVLMSGGHCAMLDDPARFADSVSAFRARRLPA